jgi:hypothetical protein
MPVSITDFEVLRHGSKEQLTIFVKDPATELLTDVIGVSGGSQFTLININGDTTEVSQAFGGSGGGVVMHPSVGVYQYELDTNTYNGEYLAAFRCLLPGEVLNNNIFVKNVKSKVFAYAAALRAQVDKAQKSVFDSIENMDKTDFQPALRLLYGHEDRHLIYYLERGCQIINLVPPYTALTVETFPFSQYGSILIDAATIAALEAQGIFAIDTDYSYQLGGNSLVIDHFTKINSFLGTLLERFDKNTVRFKQQYRAKGAIMFQWMPGGVRSARQLQSMPSGFWSRMLSSSFT